MKEMANRQKRVVAPRQEKPREFVNLKKLNQEFRKKFLEKMLREQKSTKKG